ncbi:MAG: SpoVR family protein, partial [Candidatus Aenigmarchaeota archaeon]|nr:SpoVR family protein [Candidatus Aenigmarchaeota archaeon]
VGKAIFKEIENKMGFKECLRVRQEYNDIDFLQEYLNESACRRADLYIWEKGEDNKIKVNYDAGAIKNALVMQIKNSGRPVIEVESPKDDYIKTLTLRHIDDGRGMLDPVKAEYFIKEIYKLWKNPVEIKTIIDGEVEWMSYNGNHVRKTSGLNPSKPTSSFDIFM